MVLSPDILAEINQVRSDRLHGAREVTAMALRGLRRCIERSQTHGTDKVTDLLLTAARAFAQSRPSMISITNSMSTVVYNVLRFDGPKSEMRRFILSAIDEQLMRLDNAFRSVVSNASTLVKKGDTVVTCTYSSTVLEALTSAKIAGRSFGVLILRSPSPDRTIDYGVLMCRKLRQTSIDAKVIHQEKIEEHIELASIALGGADSIFPDGSILNGAPTLRLAEEGSKRHIPFCVASETWKINPLPLLGHTISVEPGMDTVPVGLVTGLIVEYGSLEPRKICSYAEEFSERAKALWSEYDAV